MTFYPRSPCGERRDRGRHGLQGALSIHALLAESDRLPPTPDHHQRIFLSTLSLRRATVWRLWLRGKQGSFYPRSPCGERRQPQQRRGQRLVLSIHALLAESDGKSERQYKMLKILSIHALLAESDHPALYEADGGACFLSTLSLRRATLFPPRTPLLPRAFYPRSPCGERHPTVPGLEAGGSFYPRSPCGERQQLFCDTVRCGPFYPRSPCGERRNKPQVSAESEGLSIHALLAESDIGTAGGVYVSVILSIHALLAESDYHYNGVQSSWF